MYEYETADPCAYSMLKQFAAHNRKFPTEAESLMWQMLRSSQLGLPFKRQHIIGEFIADFACLPEKLIVEIDGGYHSLPGQRISDGQRTQWLEEHGYTVLRFSNEEVLGDTERVLGDIEKYLVIQKTTKKTKNYGK